MQKALSSLFPAYPPENPDRREAMGKKGGKGDETKRKPGTS